MSAPRYLYPRRKMLETISAAFAAGFGVHLWATSFHSAPLEWAGIHNGSALWFGQAVTMAAFVHALGVRVNGKWRWSPVLRLIGMTVHAVMFLWLAISGAGNTASYTYGCISFGLAYGAYSAGVDVWRALRGEPEWMAR